MEKIINFTENNIITTKVEKPNNIREMIEIRLKSQAEIETAKDNGYQIFYRDIKLPTDETVRIFFIYVSFSDIMNLNK